MTSHKTEVKGQLLDKAPMQVGCSVPTPLLQCILATGVRKSCVFQSSAVGC